MEQPIGRVLTLEIARHFAAQKSASDGMIGIAAQPTAFAVFDIDEQAAAIRTIERADGMADFRGQGKIIAAEDERSCVGYSSKATAPTSAPPSAFEGTLADPDSVCS